MIRGVFAAVLGIWTSCAHAQDWATRDFCEVEPRAATAAEFAPFDLNALEAEAAGISNSTGRFWRIESPEGAISHLWGTYHVSAPAILDLPTIVRDRITTAKTLAVEVDYTLPDRDAVLDQFNEPGRYRDPTDPFSMTEPLDLAFLSPEVQNWVLDRLDGYGTTEDALFVLTFAGLAAVLLSDPCEDFYFGTIPVQDDFIQTLGRIGRAEILGLELPTEFFADLSEDEETAKAIVAVHAAYLQPPPDNSGRAVSFQLYREGRLGLLSAWDRAFVEDTLEDYGPDALRLTNAYLVDFRNQRFLDRLADRLPEGGVFIAVGAAHLPGPMGLVSLLQDRGYKVTRIPVPGEIQ